MQGALTELRWKTGEVRGFAKVMRDMTAFRATEQDRIQLEGQLRISQRLESIGLLAAGVAHDFNNLLTAISGSAQLLERELAAPSPQLTRIRSASECVAQAVRELQTFGRRTNDLRRGTDLTQVVKEVCELAWAEPGGVTITMELAPELDLIDLSEPQVGQMILNLLSSLVEAMSEGGEIAVRTSSSSSQDGTQWVLLDVIDAGDGMDSATLFRLIEPHFSKKREVHSGLGLTSINTTLLLLGGRLEIGSQPGVGTRVRIWLPVRCDGVVESRTIARSATPSRFPSVTLVVDDEPDVQATAASMLTDLGALVLTASNSGEALELCAARPEIDFVLADIAMPGMSGHRLSEALRRVDTRKLAVGLMTRYSDSARATSTTGPAPTIMKPLTLSELESFVSESWASTGVTAKARVSAPCHRSVGHYGVSVPK